jgi:hypothetical protein
MTELVTGEQYPVRVRCPSCGETGIVPVTLRSRVTMTEGENSHLSVSPKTPRLPHVCGQLTIEEALRQLGQKDAD